MVYGTKTIITAWSLALAVPAQGRAQADPKPTEQAAAHALLDNRLTPERDQALALALELGPRAGPELRWAVIQAAWTELRGETVRPEGSEAVFDYMEAVARLRDPRAIPFLVEVLANGPSAANALADIGGEAFQPILVAVEDVNRDIYVVAGGLTALRFMMEDGLLGSAELALLREAVARRLSGTQDSFVVEKAMALAVALEDRELLRIVKAVAVDRKLAETLVSRFVSDGTLSDWYLERVSGVQETARALLAGEPPIPVRRPYSRREDGQGRQP